MHPQPTKNNWPNLRDQNIYIDNKAEFELKSIVYYKASKFEAPEDRETIHVEPKKKKSLKVNERYTGIYCDILCDKSSINGKLGWALSFIGDFEELKEAMDLVAEAICRTLDSEGLPDFDVKFSDGLKE
jgi:hypothetical protein